MFRIKSVRLPFFISFGLGVAHLCTAQQPSALDKRIKAVMARPEFAHSRFGIEFYSVDTRRPVYTLNEQELFVPGSTTKLLTEGTALELFGSDYRFHTRVYRTGPLTDGTVAGDLVLVRAVIRIYRIASSRMILFCSKTKIIRMVARIAMA